MHPCAPHAHGLVHRTRALLTLASPPPYFAPPDRPLRTTDWPRRRSLVDRGVRLLYANGMSVPWGRSAAQVMGSQARDNADRR